MHSLLTHNLYYRSTDNTIPLQTFSFICGRFYEHLIKNLFKPRGSYTHLKYTTFLQADTVANDVNRDRVRVHQL